MNRAKRLRLNEKTREPRGGEEPLFRTWRYMLASTESARRNYPNKVYEWYQSSAAMLEEHPLSKQACEKYKAYPPCANWPTFKEARSLVAKLEKSPQRPAHSFMYKGYWKSISALALSAFYEDSALHEVGKIRMAEWWRAQKDVTVPRRTGVALTFWYSLDGSHVLPDAIEVGLKSTLTAEFEVVFCLTYQSFTNMPSHVRTINCERLLSYSHRAM